MDIFTFLLTGVFLLLSLCFCGAIPLLLVYAIISVTNLFRFQGNITRNRKFRKEFRVLAAGEGPGVNPEKLGALTAMAVGQGFAPLGDVAYRVARGDEVTDPEPEASPFPDPLNPAVKAAPLVTIIGFQRIFVHLQHGCILRLISSNYLNENCVSKGPFHVSVESYSGTGVDGWQYTTTTLGGEEEKDLPRQLLLQPRRLFTKMGRETELGTIVATHLAQRESIAKTGRLSWDRSPDLAAALAAEERYARFVRNVYEPLTPFKLWLKGGLRSASVREWMGELE